jgi:AcrR family transcriptional regulator
MAEISRRAGVGMATLYRNFSSRRELLEALYIDEVDAVCRAAETIDGDTPGATLVAWLARADPARGIRRSTAGPRRLIRAAPVAAISRPGELRLCGLDPWVRPIPG